MRVVGVLCLDQIWNILVSDVGHGAYSADGGNVIFL